MLLRDIWLALLSIGIASAQSVTVLSGSASGTLTGDNVIPTDASYLSYSSTITLPISSTSIPGSGSNSTATASSSGNSSDSSITSRKSTSSSVTLLVGSTSNIGNATASSTTSSSARASNTQACNGWPEFCSRSYSNITMVTAHNSPFAKKNNAASNQDLDVTDQLNDGIRMVQGQTHYVNDTLYYCHTSCELLNVGTVESQFKVIENWVAAHPYDVVTILIGNSEQVSVEKYVAPIQSSGLGRWVYTPPKIPMALGDWPTLGEMILRQYRVVIFMDYKADQVTVPYVLDEFSQLWETPFSPTNDAFPCTTQRPPGLNRNQSLDRMYMANHNLNQEISLLGSSLLVPNTAAINQTNSVSGAGSLGNTSESCTDDWNRPPNFLLVDYYNRGNVPGSVFEVAAKANGVTYNKKCCGLTGTSTATRTLLKPSHILTTFVVVLFASLL